MKKLPIYIISFLMISSLSYSQQQMENLDATASIILISPLQITPSLGDLDFGTIMLTGSGFPQAIDPNLGKLFVVWGEGGRDIFITFGDATLDNSAWITAMGGGTPGTLTFTPNVELDDHVTTINSGDSQPLTDIGSGIGELNLWVGGSIFIAGTQAHGDYTGLFTITVSY